MDGVLFDPNTNLAQTQHPILSMASRSTPTPLVRPDKFTDRIGWNRSWENDLQRNEPLSAEACDRLQRLHGSIGAGQQPFVDGQNQDIWKIQNDIREFALPKLATDGLEERWGKLERPQREEIILEAFFQTSCAGPNMENHRRWCPDMTIDNMAAKNGQLFLDLLNTIVAKFLISKPEPVFFPHPCIELSKINSGLSMLEARLRSHRCYFVTLVVWRVLLAMYHKEESYLTQKPPNLPGLRSLLSTIKQEYGKDTKHEAKEFSKAYQKTLDDHVNHCMCCLKGASQLAPGQQLMNCSTCKKVGRTSRYCSRECQTKDWKSGKHKKICGVPLFKLQKEEETPTQGLHDKVPASDPDFKRSFALLHQISLLNDPANIDYVYMQPGNLDDIGLTLRGVTIRMAFLINRRRALRNGDKGAVQFMFEILSKTITHPQFSKNNLKLQLEREYGVDVDNVDVEVDPPTEEETEWAGKLMLALVSPYGEFKTPPVEEVELAKKSLLSVR